MLNSREIADALDRNDGNGLTIVPRPDLNALLDRGATSVDLRLGRWFRSFRQTRVESVSLVGADPADRVKALGRARQHFVAFGDKYVLHPSRFVLGVTLEWIRLPNWVSGYVTGKSALGRHGLVIETAAGIHPRFSGCLTLELANIGEVPLEIYPGMPICQIFLHRTTEYEGTNMGSFFGSRKPRLSEPKADETFSKLRSDPFESVKSSGTT